MNKDTVQGNWAELKGKIKTKWAKLTEDDLNELNGKLEKLSGTLQKKYGYAKAKAEKEYKEFKTALKGKAKGKNVSKRTAKPRSVTSSVTRSMSRSM